MRRTSLVVMFTAVLLGAAVPSLAHRHYWPGWYAGMSFGPWWGWSPYAYVGGPYYGGPAPALAVVDTDVEPEHARVYLNGELIGTADDFDGFPDYLYLERGRYTLEFRVSGYQSGTLEVEARAGRFFPVDLKLKRVAGEAVAPWYDRPQGLPVSRVYGPAQKGGQDTVEARPDPELREELRARPGDDEDAEDLEDGTPPADARTPRNGAALDIRVSPSNASVYLDGEFFGTAEELRSLERGAAVSPGRHRLEVLAPGHTPRALEVELQAGERRQVVVELEGGLDKPNGGS